MPTREVIEAHIAMLRCTDANLGSDKQCQAIKNRINMTYPNDLLLDAVAGVIVQRPLLCLSGCRRCHGGSGPTLQNGSQRGTSIDEADATVAPRERATDTASIGRLAARKRGYRESFACGGSKNFKVMTGVWCLIRCPSVHMTASFPVS